MDGENMCVRRTRNDDEIMNNSGNNRRTTIHNQYSYRPFVVLHSGCLACALSTYICIYNDYQYDGKG